MIETKCLYVACKNIEARRQGYITVEDKMVNYERTNLLNLDYIVHKGKVELKIPVVLVFCEQERIQVFEEAILYDKNDDYEDFLIEKDL